MNIKGASDYQGQIQATAGGAAHREEQISKCTGEVEQDPAGRLRHVLHPYDRQLTLSSIHYWYWETEKHATSGAGRGPMTSILKHHYVVTVLGLRKTRVGGVQSQSLLLRYSCGHLWGISSFRAHPSSGSLPAV